MMYVFRRLTSICSVFLFSGFGLSAEALTPKEMKQIAADRIETPLVQAAYLGRAPVIDGKLGEGEWAQATRVTGFIDMATKTYYQRQSEVYIGWNDTDFLIGYRGFFPAGTYATRAWDESALRSFVRERDGRVFDDDSVELYLKPDSARNQIQLIANSRGTIFDRRKGEPEWNGEWRVASRVDDAAGVWEMEVAISFEALEEATPQPGEVWDFNVARTWKGLGQAFTSLTGEYRKKMAELVFTRGGPVVREVTFGRPIAGMVKGRVEIVAGSKAGKVDTTFTLQNDEGRRTMPGSGRRHVGVAPHDKRGFSVEGRIVGTGLYSMKINAVDLATDKLIHYRVVPFEVLSSIQLEPFIVLSPEKIGVLANMMTVTSDPDVEVSRITFTLSAGEKVLAATEIELPPQKPFAVYFTNVTVSTLPRDVEMACVVETDDQPVTQRVSYSIPPKPSWYGAYEVPDGFVPSPWTPLAVTNGASIDCWNRRYAFGSMPLPQQIQVAGTPLLADPIHLIVETADGSLQWDDQAVSIEEQSDSKITLSKSSTVSNLNVQVVSSVEFDGFMYATITLTPNKPVDLRRVRIEIPLPDEVAQLFHVKGDWGEKLFGAVADREAFDAVSDERLYQWLGNDDMGICWLTDSTADWQESDKMRIGFDESNGRMVGYLQPWSVSQTLDRPLTIWIGLQATPTRPNPNPSYHFMTAYNKPPAKVGAVGTKSLDSVIEMSLAGKMNYPPFEKDAPMIQSWIDGYHEKGLKYIVYQYADAGTETEDYKMYWGDWVTDLPPSFYQWRTATAKCCFNSSWSDYYCHTLDVMMGEFGADGMYLDGVKARECNRKGLHGHPGKCGDGIWSIVALREHYKKLLYVARRHKGAESVIVGHVSVSTISPVSGLFDVLLKAENYGAPLSYNDMTPDVIRAELGRQWGPQSVALAQLTKKQMIPIGRFLGSLMLNGVQSAPSFLPPKGRTKMYFPLIKVLDGFPIADATFMAYYEQDLVTETEGRPVSLYRHNDGKQLLLVVANQSDQATTFHLDFNLTAHNGPKTISRITEKIEGRLQNVEDGTVAVELEPWDLKMLKVLLVD